MVLQIIKSLIKLMGLIAVVYILLAEVRCVNPVPVCPRIPKERCAVGDLLNLRVASPAPTGRAVRIAATCDNATRVMEIGLNCLTI